MKKILILSCVLSLVICLGAQAGFADQGLEDADKLFNESKFSEAASAYEVHLESNPGDYETTWRLAQCYSKWAWSLSKKKKAKKEYLAKSVDYARKAIEINDNGFGGHIYLAQSLGMLSKFVNSETKVRFSREIKEAAEKARDLNPSDSKPYMILGIWHRKVEEASWIEKGFAETFFGGLPDSSIREAERNLKKTIELRPNFIENHYELALVYKAMRKKKQVIEELKKASDCPVSTKKEEEIKKKVDKLLNIMKRLI